MLSTVALTLFSFHAHRLCQKKMLIKKKSTLPFAAAAAVTAVLSDEFITH